MSFLRFDSGLTLRVPSPPMSAAEPKIELTEEAGVRGPVEQTLRVTPLVKVGDIVAQGAAVACLRDAPEVRLVAPMPGRVAKIALRPGSRLSEIVLFREAGGDVVRHRVTGEVQEQGLRHLMQQAGFWPYLRRRPFGGLPGKEERPAAIVVMATDTRPFAPDPRRAVIGREEPLARGLDALTKLTDGPVIVCAQPGPPLFDAKLAGGRIRTALCGARHPQGSAGIRIHDLFPAKIGSPVWDLHVEDVAALGDMIKTGVLPMTRLVSVAGAALRESRLVRTQPGADLRGLTYRALKPGAHVLMSGSPIDGHEAHWLGLRNRQVTALPRPDFDSSRHWLVSALLRSATPKPVIPTAALDQAFGGAIPAAPFVRALSAGDEETAIKLGIESLLEEDVALADYVVGGEAHLKAHLRAVLDRIRQEYVA